MIINSANKYEKVDKEGNKTTSITNYFFLVVGCSGYIATYDFTFAFDVNDNYSFDNDIKLKKISMEVDPNYFHILL